MQMGGGGGVQKHRNTEIIHKMKVVYIFLTFGLQKLPHPQLVLISIQCMHVYIITYVYCSIMQNGIVMLCFINTVYDFFFHV